MSISRSSLCALMLSVATATPALGLANRVFVSARSGNNANACDNVNTPCQTFAGAVVQLNPDGEVIVLDSGGYGPVTITQGVTIEAPAGVTAFIHPPSGDAITVNAGSNTVTLKGLTLNVGAGNGITVNSVGTLNVENDSITGFANDGIAMLSAGRLNIKGTDIKGCLNGVFLAVSAGTVQASIDHCHFDGNALDGFSADTTSPGSSTTTATYSTANNNTGTGWRCGNVSTGKDVLNLEHCASSENANHGVVNASTNTSSSVRFSDCIFSNNGIYGTVLAFGAKVETRGNNTITGNGSAPSLGAPTPFGAL
jgi:Right handed beta helix region